LFTQKDICIQKDTVLWYNLKLMTENGYGMINDSAAAIKSVDVDP